MDSTKKIIVNVNHLQDLALVIFIQNIESIQNPCYSTRAKFIELKLTRNKRKLHNLIKFKK